MLACAGLFEPKKSRLELLKIVFNAKNFIRRLPWSISSQNVRCSQKLQKIFTKNTFLEGSRSFKVIDVNESKKPVVSPCYDDKQHVCTYLQPFSRYTSQ